MLGGQQNSLAVARNLGACGIDVIISGKRTCWGLYTKYCKERLIIPDEMSSRDYWDILLLSDDNPDLHGAIVFPMNDEALEFLIDNADKLRSLYILDDFDPEIYRILLDKIATLELAQGVDVPTPRYWKVETRDDLAQIAKVVQFPAMIKPVHTHRFARMFGAKLFIVHDIETLHEKASRTLDQQVQFMIVEMAVGPDTNLTSFYTYITKDGDWLYEYTKNVVRRYPISWGIGCCHESKWHPATAALGSKFFSSIGFRGFANIEFKEDERDGLSKVIEVNTRFTASHELIVQSGMPLDIVIYCELTGQPVPEIQQADETIGSWLPLFDFKAYRQLARAGKLSLRDWIRDIRSRRQVLTVFRLNDPQPIIKYFATSLSKRFRLPF